MKRETYFKLFLLTLLFLLIHGIGCGTAKSVYRASADTVKAVSEKIMPEEGPVLKKRVLVIPIIDQAGAGESNLSQFSNRLADLLKENDNLLVTFLKESVTSQSRKMSSQFGMVIDKELIQRADEMEMDILVVTNLNPFDIKAKKEVYGLSES